MSKKLSMEEIGKSENAVNKMRKYCGRDFNAQIRTKRVGQNRSEIYDSQVVIGKGQYGDANMPYISITDIPKNYYTNYDCAYVKMEYYDSGSLLIYGKDKSNNDLRIDVVCNNV